MTRQRARTSRILGVKKGICRHGIASEASSQVLACKPFMASQFPAHFPLVVGPSNSQAMTFVHSAPDPFYSRHHHPLHSQVSPAPPPNGLVSDRLPRGPALSIAKFSQRFSRSPSHIPIGVFVLEIAEHENECIKSSASLTLSKLTKASNASR